MKACLIQQITAFIKPPIADVKYSVRHYITPIQTHPSKFKLTDARKYRCIFTGNINQINAPMHNCDRKEKIRLPQQMSR